MANVFKSAWGWLTKKTYEAPDPDALLDIGDYPDYQRAMNLVMVLQGNGLNAEIFNHGIDGPNGGVGPLRLGGSAGGGFSVMVRGDQLADAQRIQAEFDKDY